MARPRRRPKPSAATQRYVAMGRYYETGPYSTGLGAQRERATQRAYRTAQPAPAKYSPPGSRSHTRPPKRPKQPKQPGRDTVTAPIATPAAPTSFTPGTLSGGMGGYDPGADPAVAKAGALAGKMRATAQATAAAKRKQAAIEYGDPSGVTGLDEATITAARANPFSVLKMLERDYTEGRGRLEDELNKAGLFYSGYRGKQLSDAATAYQQAGYEAGTRFRGLLTDVEETLANALLSADMMEADSYMGSDGFYDPYEGSGWDGSTIHPGLLDIVRQSYRPGPPVRGKPSAKPKAKPKPAPKLKPKPKLRRPTRGARRGGV